jgi:hypothetical protein
VRGILNDGSPGDPSTSKSGTTLPFRPAFDRTNKLVQDGGGWAGYTLVQRIEVAALMASGLPSPLGQVKITVRTASNSGASIDRIYISQPDSGVGKNPYDSLATDLTAVYDPTPLPQPPTPFPLGPSTSHPFPAVTYTVDQTRPLLIAIDFSSGAVSGIGSEDAAAATPPDPVFMWFSNSPGSEASKPTRTGTYSPQQQRLDLIEKIEVG